MEGAIRKVRKGSTNNGTEGKRKGWRIYRRGMKEVMDSQWEKRGKRKRRKRISGKRMMVEEV